MAMIRHRISIGEGPGARGRRGIRRTYEQMGYYGLMRWIFQEQDPEQGLEDLGMGIAAMAGSIESAIEEFGKIPELLEVKKEIESLDDKVAQIKREWEAVYDHMDRVLRKLYNISEKEKYDKWEDEEDEEDEW
jgi:uncharacterized coiled-coil protein SlyX